MEMTQTEIVSNSKATEIDISIPLQNLFDECLNFISLNDFDF